jgi:hypothetical protein
MPLERTARGHRFDFENIHILWPQKVNRGPVATPAGHFFATYAP